MRYLWNSLQFRIPAVFVAALLLLLAAVFGVFTTLGRNLLERQAFEQVALSGENIVCELRTRTALAQSLAVSLANLGEALPREAELTKRLALHVLDYEGSEHFIAGGGLWPAAYRFAPEAERRSFFWGRDASGLLQYFDDCNDP